MGMPFGILDDFFLLHFSLKTAQGTFQRLSFLDYNDRQA